MKRRSPVVYSERSGEFYYRVKRQGPVVCPPEAGTLLQDERESTYAEALEDEGYSPEGAKLRDKRGETKDYRRGSANSLVVFRIQNE